MDGFTIGDRPRQQIEEFDRKKLNGDIVEVIRYAELYLKIPLPAFRDDAYRMLDRMTNYCAGVEDSNKDAMLAKNTLGSLPKFKAAMDKVFQNRDKLALDEMFGAFEIEAGEPDIEIKS